MPETCWGYSSRTSTGIEPPQNLGFSSSDCSSCSSFGSSPALFASVGLACITTLFGTMSAAISYLLGAYHDRKADELIEDMHSRFLTELQAVRKEVNWNEPREPMEN